ncbi:hypothetical protein TcCL_ESM10505 [Trypanosoma cruzi]|nr:hypothetical protein TcCL_ESM10505 [Trypanosoma cruzi]
MHLLRDGSCIKQTSFFFQEMNNRSNVATKVSGCNDFLQACTGRGGGVAIQVRHSLPCKRLSLPGTDLLVTIAVRAFPQRCSSICVPNLYNPPHSNCSKPFIYQYRPPLRTRCDYCV